MTDIQFLTKIIKLNYTIRTFVRKGGTLKSLRGLDLLGRYDDMKREARHRCLWTLYCEEMKITSDHNGYDLFA